MQPAIETGQRPRKKRKTVFTFEELSPAAQERAIEASRDYELCYEWYDYLYEDWRTKLGEKGFEEVEFFWSGFYSQGDGASFTATVNLEKYIKANLEEMIKNRVADIFTFRTILKNDPSVSDWEIDQTTIRQQGPYYHEMTMDYCLDWRGNAPPAIEKAIPKLGDFILEDARNLARKLYQDLENEYEYLTGDECTAEKISDSDFYQFTRDGEPI